MDAWTIIFVIVVLTTIPAGMSIIGYGFLRHHFRTGETWEATEARKEREAKGKQP